MKLYRDGSLGAFNNYNKANLRTILETRALSNLEKSITRLIEDKLKIEVECVNTADNHFAV
jgi:hypothetical protein